MRNKFILTFPLPDISQQPVVLYFTVTAVNCHCLCNDTEAESAVLSGLMNVFHSYGNTSSDNSRVTWLDVVRIVIATSLS